MILLKNEISNPLEDLFNLSFSSGKFPSILKISKVAPIYKKYSKLDYQNYRPTSSLSNIEKILINLINLTENIRQALDEQKIGCGIIVDLQKAFDTVEHEVLLSKLDHYGVRGLTNN